MWCPSFKGNNPWIGKCSASQALFLREFGHKWHAALEVATRKLGMGGGDFPIRLAVPLNTMYLRLELDLTVFQLRSHTWFQHSVKLRFLMSHCRKNSVRDKVIGNKWIYLKRNTLHRQCGLSQNVSCCSVTQLCPTLCYPMDWSTPVFPVLHHLLEFAQTSVLWVGDTVQRSHPLLPPPPPAFNFSQHRGLF